MKKVITILFIAISHLNLAQVSINESEWDEDLEFLKNSIMKTVPNIDESKINTEFNSITNGFHELSHSQKLLSIQRLLANLNDEGNKVLPIQSALENALLPIKTYWFEEGLYMLDASNEYQPLVNQKVESIAGIQLENLFNRLSPYLSADNENYKKHIFPFYVQTSLWLKGVGAIPEESNEVEITTENGQTISVAFKGYNEYSQLSREHVGLKSEHEGENYWKSYDVESKTLTVQFKAIMDNDKGDSFSKFVKGIDKDLSSGKVDKLIIDNRFGGGGNGFKLKSFTDLIRENEAINQRGKLFVFTSRATRGTVMELTSILELNTKAIIIGEGTGEGPNSVGDIKVFELPNSKINISLTHKFWPTSWETDKRAELSPNVKVSYTFKNHQDKVDPWMETMNGLTKNNEMQELPNDLLKSLLGKYEIDGQNIIIDEKEGKLLLSMKRKMISFFEIHSELYFEEEGELATDIDGVVLRYNKATLKPKELSWKGKNLIFE